MYVAVVVLVPDERTARRHDLDNAVVTDILWTAASEADGLEHIHSRAASDRIELTMFHRVRAQADAAAAAERICRQALNSSPSLHGWQLARG
jgi:hypothetical protein